MKILAIAPFVPWPLDHGGRIRLYHLLKGLSRKHRVTLVCLADEQPAATAALEEFCHQVVTVFHKPGFLPVFWRFLAGPLPYNAERFSSPKLLAKVRELVAQEHFDLVHIETTHVWPAAAACTGMPVVLGTQNVESNILAQLTNVCRNPLKRALYRLETLKMRRFEQMAWHSASLCLTVSDAERAEVIRAGVVQERVETVPNGVDLERFAFRPRPGGKRLLFLCGLDYHPNLDAARWLLDEIWPVMSRSCPDARLVLAGRETERLALSHSGVSCLGDPADVPGCFAEADILLVPLRIGGGTRLKVLEAMASGLPVVSTAKGREGTLARDGEHLLQAETPTAFATACRQLLLEPELSQRLAGNARKLVEESYSWPHIVAGLEAILEAIASGGAI